MDITLSKHPFGEDLFDDQIAYWQRQGPTAIWEAAFEILEEWFLLRGLDPKVQRIDRSRVEKHLPPWLGGAADLEE